MVIFLFKKTSLFKNQETYQVVKQESGLTYDTTIGELTIKDLDQDGVPDWEEPLYGLDPTKKETTEGIPDKTIIDKQKIEQGISLNSENAPNLTETEKFSQQLFSTVASLNQNGVMNQSMVDQITSSLSEQIKNTVTRRVFISSNLKIINDDSLKTIETYRDAMIGIQNKYPDKGNVFDILQRFIVDENAAEVDSSVLIELDPIIEQTQNAINALLKVGVPKSLVELHLNFLNAGEKLLENIGGMKLFETDPILALGAMSKYEENIDSFQNSIYILINAVAEKLNN